MPGTPPGQSTDTVENVGNRFCTAMTMEYGALEGTGSLSRIPFLCERLAKVGERTGVSRISFIRLGMAWSARSDSAMGDPKASRHSVHGAELEFLIPTLSGR